MARASSSWTRDAQQALSSASSDFKQSLKDISEALARTDQSEKVLKKHVDESFDVLALSGNRRRHWMERHESAIWFGGIMMGVSASVNDVINSVAPGEFRYKQAIITGTAVAALIGGLCLTVLGWWRIRKAVVWGWIWKLPDFRFSSKRTDESPVPQMAAVESVNDQA